MDNNGKQPTSSSSTNNRQQEDHASLRVDLHADVTTASRTTNEDEEEDWSEDSDAYGNDYEYFDIIEEADEFLEEGQGSNSEDYDDDGMEEEEEEEDDEIDPDDMSYEELLALGDFIGREKRGLSLDQISAPGCLRPKRKLLEFMVSGDEVDRCVICQVEYGEDDDHEVVSEIVGCGHSYHKGCITDWLMVKKSCPICGYEVSPISSLSSSSSFTSANVKNSDGGGGDGNGGGFCNG